MKRRGREQDKEKWVGEEETGLERDRDRLFVEPWGGKLRMQSVGILSSDRYILSQTLTLLKLRLRTCLFTSVNWDNILTVLLYGLCAW